MYHATYENRELGYLSVDVEGQVLQELDALLHILHSHRFGLILQVVERLVNLMLVLRQVRVHKGLVKID